MGWRIAVLVGLGLAAVLALPAAAPVGVSCLMTAPSRDRLVDAWIAENAPTPTPTPTPEITPESWAYGDVKAGEGPAPIGEERVTTEELARYLVRLKGCDDDA
ncbi:hypothetical protein ACIBI7_49000 [Nonomuraea fuscirosea]|uniref:hypothetical protein n=1 Tax=Nonomuraea fuscirosea TaxID=1291556 RepID=UPI003789ED75